jgi:prepilin-type N-terminal cleavage/methylation domain-containing protein
MKKQRGFTAVELVASLFALAGLAGFVFLGYAAGHFISKFW